MNKKKWNKERILWKANQFRSISQSLKRESNSSFEKLCEKYIDSDDEILLFFFKENGKEWTAVTTDKIISYHSNNIYQMKFDDIKKSIDIKKDGIPDNELKYCVNFLLIGKEKLPIWTPDSSTLFALMNILKMFPLKEKI
ncbi:hypothetical protein [Snodgrassella communis]|uniref:hypothetical protein n=1 Tax=Snodgrassella communis TaxID=2946699 RepID=UPI001EF4A4E9|nr:hypothetical protein [Snodgrassella communis]